MTVLNRIPAFGAAAAFAIAIALPAGAHHSTAAFDNTRVVKIEGTITQFRINFDNSGPAKVVIKSFHTAPDTRHNVNNLNFIRGVHDYFLWTRDISFLRNQIARAKTGLKAATIMQGESTSARAGAIAHDFFMRGRIRTLDEIKNAIDSVSLDRVNTYLKQHKPGPFTIVTVGPKELKLPK